MKFRTFILFLLIVPIALYAKKPRIAITDFDYKAGSAEGSWAVGQGIADMLATALVKSGKFDVFERKQMASALEEQKLGMTGLTTPESAARAGKILGVQYIIIGSVNQFGQKKETAKAFGVEVNNLTARVATDTRIVDVETTRIINADTGTGEESAPVIAVANPDLLPTDVEFGSKGFDETVIGKATKKCVDDLVNKFSKSFGNIGIEGKIIKVDGKKAYVNLGKDSGISVGNILIIKRQGEELKDPDTGESLGSDTREIGSIKITDIKDKFSIAEIIDEKEAIAKDDIAVLKK